MSKTELTIEVSNCSKPSAPSIELDDLGNITNNGLPCGRSGSGDRLSAEFGVNNHRDRSGQLTGERTGYCRQTGCIFNSS